MTAKNLSLTYNDPVLVISADEVKFRYLGDVGQAKGGVVTLATYRDRLRGTVQIGICLTPPGQKFDAEFSRVVSMYRLYRVHIPADLLEMRLAACRDRVQKKRVRVRMTDAERADLLSRLGEVSEAKSVGYYKFEIESFELSDFDVKAGDLTEHGVYRYGLEVEDIEEDDTHADINMKIGEDLLIHSVGGALPGWAFDLIHALVTGDEDEDENEDSDDGLVPVTSLLAFAENETLAVDVASVTDGEIFALATDEEGSQAIASPVFDSVHALRAWAVSVVEACDRGVTVTEIGDVDADDADDEIEDGDEDVDADEDAEDEDSDDGDEDEFEIDEEIAENTNNREDEIEIVTEDDGEDEDADDEEPADEDDAK